MTAILQRLKSKTYALALLLSVLGAIQGSMGVFTAYLSPQAMGWLTLLVGVAVAILRELTNKALSEK